MTELLSCPFCGATPHRGLTKVKHCQLHGDPYQDFRIWCPHGCAKVERSEASAIAAWNTRAPTADAERIAALEGGTSFYIDCEFDGHDGALLSMALVRDGGDSIHIKTDATPTDPWVVANVMPIMGSHNALKSATGVPVDSVGEVVRAFIGDVACPIIVADSPVDIGRFCRAISTSPAGGWASTKYPAMRFEVHNVDCYPTAMIGAVQHNAWWDAMALRAALKGTDND